MRIALVLCALLLPAACARNDTGADPAPGTPDQGDWVWFYSHPTRVPPVRQRQYFFDRSNVRRDGDRLVGRWKIQTDGPGGVTTLYVVRLECRLGTFTELGTVLFDDHGQPQDNPSLELFVDHQIEPNSSMAKFRQMFCG